MDTFEKAKAFVYRNARPLDLARFRFHFENGSIDDVLHALSFYQNDDGGFAYAIEPDNWNINSNPIGAWAAAMILREIGFTDTEHPIMKGLLNYLDSGKDFSGGKWYNTVAGNNDYPHAVWWECDDPEGIPSDNPTVSLAGFALCFADKNSSIYQKAGGIAKKAVRNFLQNPTDMHATKDDRNLAAEILDESNLAVKDYQPANYAQLSNAFTKLKKEKEKSKT